MGPACPFRSKHINENNERAFKHCILIPSILQPVNVYKELQSQSKWLGHFGVSLSPQCWCTRFGDRTAKKKNNFERDGGEHEKEKKQHLVKSVLTIFVWDCRWPSSLIFTSNFQEFSSNSLNKIWYLFSNFDFSAKVERVRCRTRYLVS